VDSVFCAISAAIALARVSPKAVFRIFDFTTSVLSSWLSISARTSSETPFLPIRTVGLSALNARFILRFILGVIMYSASDFSMETASACRSNGR
jgi:hypothetical protein